MVVVLERNDVLNPDPSKPLKMLVHGKNLNVCNSLIQPPGVVAISNVATSEREGRYVQHNVGALDGGDMEEYYLVNDTEKRLGATKSTTSFQAFEMKQKTSGSSDSVRSSQVGITGHTWCTQHVTIVSYHKTY